MKKWLYLATLWLYQLARWPGYDQLDPDDHLDRHSSDYDEVRFRAETAIDVLHHVKEYYWNLLAEILFEYDLQLTTQQIGETIRYRYKLTEWWYENFDRLSSQDLVDILTKLKQWSRENAGRQFRQFFKRGNLVRIKSDTFLLEAAFQNYRRALIRQDQIITF